MALELTFGQAEETQGQYRVFDEGIRRALGRVDLLTMTGPTNAGKTYFASHCGYHLASNLVTRAVRVGENARHVPMNEMLLSIQEGRLVQYAAILPDKIYATDIDCFSPDQVNVKEIAWDVVDTLPEQGFGKVLPVGVVAEPIVWWPRISRFFTGGDKPLSQREIKSRLDEGEESAFSLARSDNWAQGRLMIVTNPGDERANVRAIKDYVEVGKVPDNTYAHEVAERMLNFIPCLRGLYLK